MWKTCGTGTEFPEPGEHTVKVVDTRETNCYIEGKKQVRRKMFDKVLKEK